MSDAEPTTDDSIDIEPGDRIRGMRRINKNWKVSITGTVTEIYETAPVPGVEGPVAIVHDDPNDETHPVRVKNIDKVTDYA